MTEKEIAKFRWNFNGLTMLDQSIEWNQSGGTGDDTRYNNVRSTDCTCNIQHQKSRQST